MPHTCDQATAIHKSTNPTVTTTINAEWRQIKSNNNNKAKYSYVCSIAFWIACSTIIIIVDWIASTGYPSGGTHCVCVSHCRIRYTHTHTQRPTDHQTMTTNRDSTHFHFRHSLNKTPPATFPARDFKSLAISRPQQKNKNKTKSAKIVYSNEVQVRWIG